MATLYCHACNRLHLTAFFPVRAAETRRFDPIAATCAIRQIVATG